MAAAAMDDSCRRAGAIPFKWEICPGTPKHARSASAAAAVVVSPAPPHPALAKVATRQLALPPCMTSPCASPSPYYHSPRLSSAAACRSASVSPCRSRYAGGGGSAYRPRPTAFLDLAPRATTPDLYGGAAAAQEADDEPAPAPAYGCFPLPLLRRKGSSKKRGGGGYSSGSGGSSSSGSFRSDGEPGGGLRRSTSSSFSFTRGGNRIRFAAAGARQQEVEAASGSWFF
uniref:Uncharacterized protein n=1 Tax=Oryza punctata TaxID=4537 RepID=A0A0E0MD62_ORYPU